jgi:tetratricopeptide (TPR) repeat protein
VALLEPLLGKNPGNLPALLTLGNAHLAAGETDQAVRVHRMAVKLNPTWHLTHFNLAQTLRAAGDDAALHAEAQNAFREALELHPRHAESYRELAQMLAEKGSLPGAREVLAEAGAREVTDPALSLLRGAVEASLGNRLEAEEAFRQALVLDPGLAEAHAALGRLAYTRGEAAQAAESYHRALDLDPSPALARTLGSILLHDLGDLAGAHEAFLLALTLDPGAPEAATLQELVSTLEEALADQGPVSVPEE